MEADRYQRAKSIQDAGKVVEALQEFELLAKLEENADGKRSLLLDQAVCLMQLGQIAAARERCQNRPPVHPTHLQNISTLGCALERGAARGCHA